MTVRDSVDYKFGIQRRLILPIPVNDPVSIQKHPEVKIGTYHARNNTLLGSGGAPPVVVVELSKN
jgi:hypothetical protein